jgi:hypothetical protein
MRDDPLRLPAGVDLGLSGTPRQPTIAQRDHATFVTNIAAPRDVPRTDRGSLAGERQQPWSREAVAELVASRGQGKLEPAVLSGNFDVMAVDRWASATR